MKKKGFAGSEMLEWIFRFLFLTFVVFGCVILIKMLMNNSVDIEKMEMDLLAQKQRQDVIYIRIIDRKRYEIQKIVNRDGSIIYRCVMTVFDIFNKPIGEDVIIYESPDEILSIEVGTKNRVYIVYRKRMFDFWRK